MGVMEQELLTKFGKLNDVGKKALMGYVSRLANAEIRPVNAADDGADKDIFRHFYGVSLNSLDFWDNEEDEVWDSV